MAPVSMMPIIIIIIENNWLRLSISSLQSKQKEEEHSHSKKKKTKQSKKRNDEKITL